MKKKGVKRKILEEDNINQFIRRHNIWLMGIISGLVIFSLVVLIINLSISNRMAIAGQEIMEIGSTNLIQLKDNCSLIKKELESCRDKLNGVDNLIKQDNQKFIVIRNFNIAKGKTHEQMCLDAGAKGCVSVIYSYITTYLTGENGDCKGKEQGKDFSISVLNCNMPIKNYEGCGFNYNFEEPYYGDYKSKTKLDSIICYS